MNQIQYKTAVECLNAIETLKALGLSIPNWMEQQYKALLESEHRTDSSDETSATKMEQTTSTFDSETPIWSKLQVEYPYNGGQMPQEKIDCVENTVRKLMEDGPDADKPGLLLGKIQCGKTDTFEDIIGLSFDKGIDIAIILTKGTNALASQTIKRMEKDFRFFKNDDRLDHPVIDIFDIMNLKGGLSRANVNRNKTVIVCKKEDDNMAQLIRLFSETSPFLKQKKVIVVDDEADFASRNYVNAKMEAQYDANGNQIPQQRQQDLAKISNQIDVFRKIPEYCRYLQVTATPYCLYLQPDGELHLKNGTVLSFKPRFTEIVPVHDAYIGGKQFFEEAKNPNSMYSLLYHQVDQSCIDVMGREHNAYINNPVSSKNIYDLTYALVSYFMATAIRCLQSPNLRTYRTSAVFHVRIAIRQHTWQKKLIDRLIDGIKKVIVDNDQTDQRIWAAVRASYENFKESNRLGREEGLISVAMPSFDEVIAKLKAILEPSNHDYNVQLVNSDESIDPLLDADSGELKLNDTANIFIGGNILDRGITIKNMICFFYGRNPKTIQQDTVLQHARMYGARSKEDMAVMRFHTTDDLHKKLERINDLDEDLRQRIIDSKGQIPEATFVGYDKNIKPCAVSKIKVSNAIALKPHKRILPVGFQTKTKTQIAKTIAEIDQLITSAPNFTTQGDGIFEMDKDLAMTILEKIESTYAYDTKWGNADRESDMRELRCALEYCAEKSHGKIYAFQRVNRDVKRIREDGTFIDGPDDGRTDTRPAREKAQDAPVLMLLREEGREEQSQIGGETKNVGWRGTAFYWPILMTQKQLPLAMYAFDQKNAPLSVVADDSEILEGIDRKDVLRLFYKGDLEAHFGRVGTEYRDGTQPVETRQLKDTTAGKYLLKDENGEWVRNPEVPFDEKHDHGIYSLNHGEFPFMLKPYKYLLLANSRNARADVMLLELADQKKWGCFDSGEFNEDGDLIDPASPIDSPVVLYHSSDTKIRKDLSTKEVVDKTVTQWTIEYPIKKVLRFKKNVANLVDDDDD